MNKKIKRGLSILGLLFVAFVISGCTANFCTVEDQARMMYVYESGDTQKDNAQYDFNENLLSIIDAAEKQGIATPSILYWEKIDERVLILSQQVATLKGQTLSDQEALNAYGYNKFLGSSGEMWSNWTTWNNELKMEIGIEQVPDADFAKLYKSSVVGAYSSYRACITTVDGNYGPTEQYYFSAKTWGYAFERGVIEGLFVYPVAWMIETFAHMFGAAGWGQVLSILLTTIIVRGVLLAATFKATLGTQKMTLLQPELAKIQAKYPNSKTNQYEKQRLDKNKWIYTRKTALIRFHKYS